MGVVMPAPDFTMYFLGVAPHDEVGHWCWLPGCVDWAAKNASPSPWADGVGPIADEGAIRSLWAREEPQVEGLPRFARKGRWTLMAMWDRSGDSRPGSHAAFAVDLSLSDADMLALCKEQYPRVFARIEAHLGRIAGVVS